MNHRFAFEFLTLCYSLRRFAFILALTMNTSLFIVIACHRNENNLTYLHSKRQNSLKSKEHPRQSICTNLSII